MEYRGVWVIDDKIKGCIEFIEFLDLKVNYYVVNEEEITEKNKVSEELKMCLKRKEF